MKCKHFNTCSAPLCPMDNKTLDGGLWYPNEEICKLRKFAAQSWIRKQKKISKATYDYSRFFAFDMLNSIKAVREGARGANPNKAIVLQQGLKASKKASNKG